MINLGRAAHRPHAAHGLFGLRVTAEPDASEGLCYLRA